MKKVFLSLMAAAAALFMSSCTKEAQLSGVEGNEAAITIGLNLENGAATKALGDGTTVNQLIYAIFNESGQLITTTVGSEGDGQVVRNNVTFAPHKETINLAKGQAYTIVFWAQHADAPYTVSPDMVVDVDYKGLNNDETRDAFYKKVEVPTVTGNTSIDVVLERPFAQVNVGVHHTDWNNALASGIKVVNSSVKLGGVATQIDLFAEEVNPDSATEIEYTLNAIPTDELKKVTICDVEENYVWLSMSYVLPLHRTNSNLLENLEFTFDPEAGNDYVLNEGLNSVPVQANYRTNIVGTILTGAIDFNITIDPIFTNDHNTHLPVAPVTPDEEGVYEITNEAELLMLAETINAGDKLAGKTVKLMNDINLEGVEWTPIDFWGPEGAALAEFDGNGYKIIGLEVKGAGSLGFIGSYAASSVLTIKNLTFEAPVVESSASFVGTVVGYTYGNITLDNVKVTGAEISTSANMGIRLGGLVGLYPADAVQPLVLNACVVEESTITGYHNLAGLVGSAMGSAATITNCQSNNNTFYHRALNAAAWQNYDANGYAEGKAVKEGCTTMGNKGYIAEGVVYNAAGEYELLNAAGMVWFADQVNVSGNNFAGKTVKVANEIDLAGIDWKPVGQTGATEFKGVFDGQGNAIYNLTVKNTDESKNCASGLFGWVESHGDEGVTIKNVTLMSPKVYGHHNVAAVVGYIYGTVEYCTVWDATIECVSVNDDANGDKCGAIAGYVGEDATINGCHVSGSLNISAGRDAGAVVGAAKEACVVSCKINNPESVSVTANGTSTGANIRAEVIGRVL